MLSFCIGATRTNSCKSAALKIDRFCRTRPKPTTKKSKHPIQIPCILFQDVGHAKFAWNMFHIVWSGWSNFAGCQSYGASLATVAVLPISLTISIFSKIIALFS